jgi:hypothetical protein
VPLLIVLPPPTTTPAVAPPQSGTSSAPGPVPQAKCRVGADAEELAPLMTLAALALAAAAPVVPLDEMDVPEEVSGGARRLPRSESLGSSVTPVGGWRQGGQQARRCENEETKTEISTDNRDRETERQRSVHVHAAW